MISCQQKRQKDRNERWEFSSIDYIGLTGFSCSIHINYTHIFMVCVISPQLHEHSQTCRSWGLLRVLQHQIWSLWNGLITNEANKEQFFSEGPGENQLFHFDLNTQGWPMWINTRKKFAWTVLCSLITNYDPGTQLLQWIRGFDCELIWWPTGQ